MTPDTDLTFGWATTPVATRERLQYFPEPLPATATPGAATQLLIRENQRFIDFLRPHFNTIWVEDHFQWDAWPALECWTTMSYLAAQNPDMRVGPIVLGQGYRNPALLAKMAATLQAFTGGRVILGLGAGWKRDEYDAYGWPYPPAGQRVAELEEACRVIRALWTESPATFQGQHHQLANAYCEPHPDPPIPLLIGGGGEKGTLRVVARYADWWDTNICPVETYAHKQRVLAEHCRAIGRDPASIKYIYFGFVSIVDDPADIARREGAHTVGGTPEQVAAELREFLKLGVSHFIIRFMDWPSTRGAERFIGEVLPRLR